MKRSLALVILLRNSRKTERGAKQFLACFVVRAAPFALLMAPVWAQSPLSLKDAVRTALAKNSLIQASGAAQKAAESKIGEARSGYLPKVNYSESWTRSDNPVLCFRRC